MNLTNFQKKLFRLPDEDLEFYGSKDTYEYFNIINRKSEKPSFFYEPVLKGEIVRSEPLEYKFYPQSFFYWGESKFGRPTITVTLEKTQGGTKFVNNPKAGIALWVFVIIFYLQIVFSLFSNIYVNTDYKVIIANLICVGVIYYFERFQIRILIDNFKKEVL